SSHRQTSRRRRYSTRAHVACPLVPTSRSWTSSQPLGASWQDRSSRCGYNRGEWGPVPDQTRVVMRDCAAKSTSVEEITIVVRQSPYALAARLQPEKRLMLAVLEGGVSDFQTYATSVSGRGRRLFADAEAWFRSTATDHPLDFENICEALGLDPSFIRAGL